jgi:deoxycytidine triphosphate deaminase
VPAREILLILRLDQWETAGITITTGPSVDGVTPIARALNDTHERVVLDLHVGEAFERDHKYISMPDTLVIRPGESVRLRTMERLSTPREVFGVVCSRASLAAQGLYVSNIKVDPCFSGQLEVAVFNGGGRPIRVKREMAFASVFFALLDAPLSENVRRGPTPTAGLAFVNWRERLRVATPFIVTGVVAVVAAILVALLLEAVRG